MTKELLEACEALTKPPTPTADAMEMGVYVNIAVPQSAWKAFTAAVERAKQEAALQELAEIAQEYNMGYGESENNRSKVENSPVAD